MEPTSVIGVLHICVYINYILYIYNSMTTTTPLAFAFRKPNAWTNSLVYNLVLQSKYIY